MHKQGSNLHYSVKGRGEFPVSMLGYDAAKAASPLDQALITSHSDPYTDSSKEVTVNLVIPRGDHRLPNAKRWGSFGWEVVGVSVEEPETVRIAPMQKVWDELLSSLTSDQREAMDYFRPKRVI
jgi:hypothetical protein